MVFKYDMVNVLIFVIFYPSPTPWKRVTGMCSGKYPFFTLPQLLYKTPLSAFSDPQDPLFHQKITKFPNFLFKIPKFGKFSVPKPKIQPKVTYVCFMWATN